MRRAPQIDGGLKKTDQELQIGTKLERQSGKHTCDKFDAPEKTTTNKIKKTNGSKERAREREREREREFTHQFTTEVEFSGSEARMRRREGGGGGGRLHRKIRYQGDLLVKSEIIC